MSAMKLGGCTPLSMHSSRADAMWNWVRGMGLLRQYTTFSGAHARTCPSQRLHLDTRASWDQLQLHKNCQSQPITHPACQRRFLARSTHQRLKTNSTTTTAHPHSSKVGLGYVHPSRVLKTKKAPKYVSGYDAGQAHENAQAFEPRPTGRVSDEREILCSALRQIGARQVYYGPNVHIVDTPKKCADALALMQEYYTTLRGGIGAVGFDTETTVYRTWGNSSNTRTSILQIATEDVCLIVQLYYMTRRGQDRGRIPNRLRQFLEDPNQLKVGVSIASDAGDLFKSYGLQVKGTVDLGDLAAQKDGIARSSLLDLDDKYGAEEWSVVKTHDIYHWDFDGQMLHRDAIWYSAVDALACKAIYENLQQGKRKSTYVPWEERYPMTPEEEYQDIIQFLRFKVKPDRIYPVVSFKVLLTQSYPRLKQIHPSQKAAKLADHYITKLLENGVLTVDKDRTTEEEQQLKPDQISAATHSGLPLKFLDGSQHQHENMDVFTPIFTPSTSTEDSTPSTSIEDSTSSTSTEDSTSSASIEDSTPSRLPAQEPIGTLDK